MDAIVDLLKRPLGDCVRDLIYHSVKNQKAYQPSAKGSGLYSIGYLVSQFQSSRTGSSKEIHRLLVGAAIKLPTFVVE